MGERAVEETAVQRQLLKEYTPFLSKVISYLEKKNNQDPGTLENLKSIYKSFTEGSIREQVLTLENCKGLLERWYQRYKIPASTTAQYNIQQRSVRKERSQQKMQYKSEKKHPCLVSDLNEGSLCSKANCTNNSATKKAMKAQHEQKKIDQFTVKQEESRPSSTSSFDFVFTENSPKSSIICNMSEDNTKDTTQLSCKMCQFSGKDLVSHYLEQHPGIEIPVHLTQKELSSVMEGEALSMPLENETQNNADIEKVVLAFLNGLEPDDIFKCPVTCPLCSYDTSKRSLMINHLLTHKIANPKITYTCRLCNATENNVSDFRDHVSTHTGEFAYKCIYCPFRGAYSSTVANHIICNHPGKEVKTIVENTSLPDSDTLKGYTCSNCGFIQMSKSNVEKHVASVETFCRGAPVVECSFSKTKPVYNMPSYEECEQFIPKRIKIEKDVDFGSHTTAEIYNIPESKPLVNSVPNQSSEFVLPGSEPKELSLAIVSVESQSLQAGKTSNFIAESSLEISHMNKATASISNSSGERGKAVPLEQHGVYIQDEIEIEPSEPSTSILPFTEDNQLEKWTPVLKIKTEKIDSSYSQLSDNSQVADISSTSANKGANESPKRILPRVTNQPQAQEVSSSATSHHQTGKKTSEFPSAQRIENIQTRNEKPVKESLTSKILKARKIVEDNKAESDRKRGIQPAESTQKEVTFVCASCQFRTTDEAEFIKHTRTDHRTDLSLWCKSCGKCFSNAGVLVSHIKAGSCEKEEMIYRCGVKECKFETPSGQTFVHHLRHCHKGSPFIFCVHCQKIFTLPHCLILHMQNDCPYKEKNRKYPEKMKEKESISDQKQPDQAPPERQFIPIAPKPLVSVNVENKKVAEKTLKPSSSLNIFEKVNKVGDVAGRRGRSRGRGRGRGNRKFVCSDSSDSEDPDDPSWTPDESVKDKPILRRSTRNPKKTDSEVSKSDSGIMVNYDESSQTSEKISSEEVRLKDVKETYGKHNYKCPCCSFSGVLKNNLDDHYISKHKDTHRIACLECNVKFENIETFVDHFKYHKNDTKDSAETSNKKSGTVELTLDKEQSDGVIAKPINELSTSGTCPLETFGKIPYQAAIHEKNQKDSKLKSFEELKSADDIAKMKVEEKLKHFFKCMLWNCILTTDDNISFINHLNERHKGKKLYCAYCYKEYSSGALLTTHMLQDHGKRTYQCSLCFYRAFSKPHVQIHIKNSHPKALAKVYTCIPHGSVANKSENKESEVSGTPTTWPFRCAIGNCKFETFDPKEFRKHNELTHRSVSVSICFYCKVEFISFKRLMNHYRLHGINNFQCTYCLHGSDTKDEILIHLSVSHADKPLQIHVRAPQELDSSTSGTSLTPNSLPPQESTDQMNNTMLHKQVQMFSENKGNKTNSESKRLAVASNLNPDIPVHRIKSEIDYENKDDESNTNSDMEEEIDNEKHGYLYPKRVLNIETDVFCGMSFCMKKFSEMNLYLDHLKSYHMATNFICPHCSSSAETELEFNDHLKFHGPNLFCCNYQMCFFNHWEKNYVENHIKVQHGEQYASVVVLRESEKISRVSVQPPIISTPRLVANLNSSKTKSDTNESYICPYCHYKCQNKSFSKLHIYQELRYRRFECYLCKENFFSRKETLQHFVSSHPHSDIKCIINCNPEIESLVHNFLACKSGNEVIQNDTKNADLSGTLEASNMKFFMSFTYKCTLCSKQFEKEHELKNHLNRHKQYWPYNCSYCRKQFSDVRSLKRHISIKHEGKEVSFSEHPNVKIEEWVKKELQQQKIKHLKENKNILGEKSELKDNSDMFNEIPKLKSKKYKCKYCSFIDFFKYNVEKHCVSLHKNSPVHIIKVIKDLTVPSSSSPHLQIEDDRDSRSGISKNQLNIADECTAKCTQVKRLRCGYCPRKTSDFKDLEEHIEISHHQRLSDLYSFYFCPDPEENFLKDDTDVYECVYCNAPKENMYHLKIHWQNLHSTALFRLRGERLMSKIESTTAAAVKCGYCSVKMGSRDLIRQHCNEKHPNMAVKFVSETRYKSQLHKRKKVDTASVDTEDDSESASQNFTEKDTGKGQSPVKRLKFVAECFGCSNCNAKFLSFDQLLKHYHTNHQQLPLEYKTIPIDEKENEGISNTGTSSEISGTVSTEKQIIKCDMCSYIGEKRLVDRHVKSKHNPRFTCKHCGQFFDYAYSLKEHHEANHKDLPFSFNNDGTLQSDVAMIDVLGETKGSVNLISWPSCSFSSHNSDASKDLGMQNNVSCTDGGFSYYGKKPIEIDLTTVTVQMDIKDSKQSMKLPVVYLTQMFPMFPKVLVEDIVKAKHLKKE